jgi:phosphoribosylanthranilate isomerase
MTRVKICGLTNIDDALAAVACGADAIGFVFAHSPREITPDEARAIVTELPPYIARVGVFVGEPREMIEKVVARAMLTEVQLYLNPEQARLSLNGFGYPYQLSFRVRDEAVLDQIRELQLKRFHLDSFHPNKAGGTGTKFDWSIATQAAQLGQLTLSGGLTPENVYDALDTVRPYAVDVSSGVESSPGKKDHGHLKSFINEVRRWDSRTN